MRHNLLLGVATAALLLPGAAFAQSTGSIDFDADTDIVVTGRADKSIGGVEIPVTSKAKGVLTQEFIARQTPGNSILDTINQLPGVSFQNNDPFGSGGGTLTIRGFRPIASLTFDGVPLNDTGNYAQYSNQQLDPELIDQVNVNYGSTDVDSPTAAASGSTVNYRTIVPTDKFGVRVLSSVGDYNFFRIFGLVNTGVFTPWGTKAWFSASHAENDNVFGHRGKIDKQQYNARIYQPIGDNGDFISIAGNYNENRNNFFGSLPLRLDSNRTVGELSSQRFPANADERDYTVAKCQTDAPQTGVVDSTNTCGTAFSERYNPSNTGNIRISSRFTLADNLVFTVDPSFQYVKANGGGTVTGKEGGFLGKDGTTYYGFIGGSYYTGIDLNHDGDTLDRGSNFTGVTILAPSQTQTNRYGLIASLRYDFSDDHSVRINYSYDRGRHRQTGEAGFLQQNGVPFDVFPVNNPIVQVNGITLQKRDRLSYATLNQVSGEYRGTFFDALTVNVGIRAPFFSRDLTQNCFTTAANGFVDCLGSDATINAAYAAANPGFSKPQTRNLNYNRVLPNAGVVYKFTPEFNAFANYSKGIQVPSTDNLYNSFFFAANTAEARPSPETTDNFDGGLRYTTSTIQVQVNPWYTRYTNRLASAYDPVLDQTVYRNLGVVTKYGIDGSIGYRPVPEAMVYAFGSYLKSKIRDNVQSGQCTAAQVTTPGNTGCTTLGQAIFAPTAGKRESGAPVYTFGGRIEGNFGPVDLGVQVKRTGSRYIYDTNLPIYTTQAAQLVNSPTIYGNKTPAYTLVDLDARVSMAWAGLNDTTYLQINVQNLFDEYYVGGFTGGLQEAFSGGNASAPNAQIGSPRAFIATLNVQF